ncbi:hypothetical protein [Streptomonospora salina]|uniref:Uncharacterized protein n=1 Tax=Streptomonospora salina TaxID=104205 RepID=A0A841EIE7_9ACTN|nr:hypothetical protein [Streptomonospora salina]MBB6000130.1 hypothetical protein [Streptomonospora salina]
MSDPSDSAEPRESDLEGELVALVCAHPGAALPFLSEKTGAERETVGAALDRLTRRGALRRRGQPGFSRWYPPTGEQSDTSAYSSDSPLTQLVVSYLDDHPDARAKDIAHALDRPGVSVRSRLRALQEEGRAQCRHDPAPRVKRGSPLLWRLATHRDGGRDGTDGGGSALVLQAVADHPDSTTADVVRRVGPAVPVQAHLTRLEHEGVLSQSPTRKTWVANKRATPASPDPQRADAPALAPTAAAVARALRERAAAVEGADGTGTEQDDSLSGLRSALLHDLAAALDAALPE